MKLRVHGDIDDCAGLRHRHEHSKHGTHITGDLCRLSFCCAYCSRPLARFGLSSLQCLRRMKEKLRNALTAIATAPSIANSLHLPELVKAWFSCVLVC